MRQLLYYILAGALILWVFFLWFEGESPSSTEKIPVMVTPQVSISEEQEGAYVYLPELRRFIYDEKYLGEYIGPYSQKEYKERG